MEENPIKEKFITMNVFHSTSFGEREREKKSSLSMFTARRESNGTTTTTRSTTLFAHALGRGFFFLL